MDRRRLLAATAGTLFGVAGCLGSPPVSNRQGPKTDGSPAPSDARRRLSVVAVDDAPSEAALAFEVTMPRRFVTPERTARLRVTVTNEGPERAVTVGTGMCHVFNREEGESESGELWLLRPESAERVSRQGDRWSMQRPQGHADYGCSPSVLANGEAVTNELLVWDVHGGSGYVPPGTHRFERSFDVLEPKRSGATRTVASGTSGESSTSREHRPYDERVLAAFDWGFTLRVETG